MASDLAPVTNRAHDVLIGSPVYRKAFLAFALLSPLCVAAFALQWPGAWWGLLSNGPAEPRAPLPEYAQDVRARSPDVQGLRGFLKFGRE